MMNDSRSAHRAGYLLSVSAALVALVSAPCTGWAGKGSAISQALVGRQIVVPFDMPIHAYGVDFDGSNGFQRDDESRLERLDAWGMAFMAGDTATITEVRVSGRRIELILGAGGLSTTTLMTLQDPRFLARTDLARQTDPGPNTLHRDPSLKRAIGDRQTVTNEAGRPEVRVENARMHRTFADTVGQGLRPRRQVHAAEVYMPRAGSRLRIHFSEKVPDDMLVPEVLLQALSDQVIILGSRD